MLVVLTRVLTGLHFGVVTDFSGQMLTFDGVLFIVESQFQLYWADGRQYVWRCVGEQFANVNIMNRVPHAGGGVMVWAGISYRQ